MAKLAQFSISQAHVLLWGSGIKVQIKPVMIFDCSIPEACMSASLSDTCSLNFERKRVPLKISCRPKRPYPLYKLKIYVKSHHLSYLCNRVISQRLQLSCRWCTVDLAECCPAKLANAVLEETVEVCFIDTSDGIEVSARTVVLRHVAAQTATESLTLIVLFKTLVFTTNVKHFLKELMQ